MAYNRSKARGPEAEADDGPGGGECELGLLRIILRLKSFAG